MTTMELRWVWTRDDLGSFHGTLDRGFARLSSHVVIGVDVQVSAIVVFVPEGETAETRRQEASFRKGLLPNESLKSAGEAMCTELVRLWSLDRTLKRGPLVRSSDENFEVLLQQFRDDEAPFSFASLVALVPSLAVSQYQLLREGSPSWTFRAGLKAAWRVCRLLVARLRS